MARFHVWKFLRDKDGAAVPAADISVFLAGTSTPAYIYLNEVGGEHVGNTPQLKTNAAGYFEFWIADDNETYGYNTAQKFKISWERIGISTGYIDYVEAFASVIPVNEASDDETRNKAVSNALAKSWTDHTLDFSHLVHGIEEVDVLSTDTTKNKLISDYIVKNILGDIDLLETEVDALASVIASDFNFRTDTNPASGVAFGIDQININSTDPLKNKLASDALGKIWTDHSNFDFNTSTIGTSANNAHGLELGDPDDNDPSPNKLVSNAILNSLRGSGTAYRYDEDVDISTWTQALSALSTDPWEYTVTHNLYAEFVNTFVYDATAQKMIMPLEIENIDVNNVKVKIMTPFTAKIRCSI